jgi:hypothetical protein
MADIFRNRKFNNRLAQPTGGGEMKLRVRHLPARGKKGPRLVIRCGCCHSRVEVWYGDGSLEVNGVLASVPEWRKIFLPLLADGQERAP